MSGSGTLKRNGSERRSFYRVEEDMSHLQTFHPVTITVSSFFKQVSYTQRIHIEDYDLPMVLSVIDIQYKQGCT